MTAEEFIKDAQQNPEKGWTTKKMLIEFAKYHVQQALEAVRIEAEVEFLDEQGESVDYSTSLDFAGIICQIQPSSILDSYDIEENIK